ncbi:MAG: TetR/AcrR family transcriptional regulator [Bacteroidia bacterium]
MAPKSSSQFEEIRERSKEKIIEAALKLFAEESYHATSIAKIAKKAGVSKGLMYNYFHSKEDLLNAILDDAMKRAGDMATEMMQAKSAKAQIKYIVEIAYEWIVNHEEYSKTLMTLSLHVGKFPQMQKIVDGKIESLKFVYYPIFEKLGFENPEMEAKIFGALIDGMALQYVSVGDKMGIDELKDYIIDKYCNNSINRTQ